MCLMVDAENEDLFLIIFLCRNDLRANCHLSLQIYEQEKIKILHYLMNNKKCFITEHEIIIIFKLDLFDISLWNPNKNVYCSYTETMGQKVHIVFLLQWLNYIRLMIDF
ncbi:hypothetical protein BD770DRAFT_413195 [Pilaira anomala]|nr:hypothetical protein BD770DRAFT_413195 [Pilaira anomala]